MAAFEKIKKILAPPVTAEWVDTVIAHRVEKEGEIEAEKGPEAAAEYREKTDRMTERMIARGVIPSAD